MKDCLVAKEKRGGYCQMKYADTCRKIVETAKKKLISDLMKSVKHLFWEDITKEKDRSGTEKNRENANGLLRMACENDVSQKDHCISELEVVLDLRDGHIWIRECLQSWESSKNCYIELLAEATAKKYYKNVIGQSSNK